MIDTDYERKQTKLDQINDAIKTLKAVKKEIKLSKHYADDLKIKVTYGESTDIPVQRSISVTFEFTKKELEEFLNSCVDNESLDKLEMIQTLIREGWELTSIFKQIEKENDPNRGMITIELTRF